MREILADLVAEQQALDQMLQRAPERDWKRSTRAKGWTVQDTISHLAWSEDYALHALQDERTRLREIAGSSSVDGFNELGVKAGRGKRPQEVIEWWRFSRAAVVDSLSRTGADARVPWIVGDMSARTFATFRLMETWAHGLDIRAALQREDDDTPRLRHIAWLGWATLPYAFGQAGEDYDEPIRVELTGPGYARWVFGPEDSDQTIKGAAGEWCRLVVRRMDGTEAKNLTATGTVAKAALRLARIFP
ncbi:MAG: maleylpyruvate isomerase family mycothiol-dependent enzyme [Actinobacteria bacterium]|nr:maleylpyruvate isomerase family mycothiol-dependent enzyme [Actinomycetota bacterium]